jgi:mannose-6-phosphate isomerase-like protein (cupin superfamily)
MIRVIHETEGAIVPDICGTAVELINAEGSGTRKVSFAKLIIEPFKESKKHHHKVMEEVYYLLRGTARVTIGDDAHDVREGHAVFLPPNVDHQIRNTGDQELIFVCANGPPFDPGDVYET